MSIKLHDCKEELRTAGSRATPGRVALLKVLEHERRPLSVAQLQKKLPRLNTVTLYRALDALEMAGLVRRGIGVADRTAHFEYAQRPHHHHLVCTDCGFSKMCQVC